MVEGLPRVCHRAELKIISGQEYFTMVFKDIEETRWVKAMGIFCKERKGVC